MFKISTNRSLFTIYILALVNMVFFIISSEPQIIVDTTSYMVAFDELIDNDFIHVNRTPVYPLYLGIMRFLTPHHHYVAVAIGQHLLFLLSIYPFYTIAKQLNLSERRALFLTLVYAICPGFFTWNSFILTESFTMAGCVFLVHSFFGLQEKCCKKYILYFTITLIILIFLRPAQVYLLPVTAFMWLILWKKKNKRLQVISGLFCVTFVTVLLMGYMFVFQQKYGIFASSRVATFNELLVIREYGLLKPEYAQTPELRQDIETNIKEYGEKHPYNCATGDSISVKLWNWVGYIFQKHDLAEIHHVVKTSILNNPIGYGKSIIGRAYRASNMSIFKDYFGNAWISPKLISIDFISIGMLYMVLSLFFVVTLYNFVNLRCIPWFSLSVFLIGLSNMFVAIVGAPDDWDRLVAPSLPLYLLLFGVLCNIFEIRPLKSLLFK